MAGTTIKITELGVQGDGIHYAERGAIFVDGAIPGDEVRVSVNRDPQGMARGEIIEILTPSRHRIEAPCVHSERCGNCTLQHLEDSYYRRWKQDLVRNALQQLGVRPKQWLEPIFVGNESRRRVTFVIHNNRGKVKMGYYRRRSQIVSEIDSCLVAEPRLMELRELIKPVLAPLLVEGKSLNVFLQIVGNAADMVLTGTLGETGEPDDTCRVALEALMRATIIKRITWRAIEGANLKILCCHDNVVAKFGKLSVALPPDAFLQPTVDGELALVGAVMAALPAKGNFADLFSGCGTFAGPMTTRGFVNAYESSVPAVNALVKAGKGKRLRAFRRDLFRNPIDRDELNQYDAIVFDPPRAGCYEQAKKMAHSKAKCLIGVSCNPLSFAQDAGVLCDGGYELQSVQVVDQFRWSHHTELVGVFSK